MRDGAFSGLPGDAGRDPCGTRSRRQGFPGRDASRERGRVLKQARRAPSEAGVPRQRAAGALRARMGRTQLPASPAYTVPARNARHLTRGPFLPAQTPSGTPQGIPTRPRSERVRSLPLGGLVFDGRSYSSFASILHSFCPFARLMQVVVIFLLQLHSGTGSSDRKRKLTHHFPFAADRPYFWPSTVSTWMELQVRSCLPSLIPPSRWRGRKGKKQRVLKFPTGALIRCLR